jgi:hypothetical protein
VKNGKPSVAITPLCRTAAVDVAVETITVIRVASLPHLDGFTYPCSNCEHVEHQLLDDRMRVLLTTGSAGKLTRRKLVARSNELSEYHCSQPFTEDDFLDLVRNIETSLLVCPEPPEREIQ